MLNNKGLRKIDLQTEIILCCRRGQDTRLQLYLMDIYRKYEFRVNRRLMNITMIFCKNILFMNMHTSIDNIHNHIFLGIGNIKLRM